jgi:exo-beta-1,3-glucanase (GH17 family)
MICNRYSMLGLMFATLTAQASENPIDWEIISETLPDKSSIYNIYQITYKVKSNLPFTMPTPLQIGSQTSTEEFIITDDNCTGLKLNPGETCLFTVTLNPEFEGSKSALLQLNYGDNQVPLPELKTVTAASWAGAIGADYNPNHYPVNLVLNFHDVFYVGTSANQPISNVYAELAQLQAAGFNTVRSYQTVEYSWIDIINQANALGMNVVYEAVIPQSGGPADITAAQTLLTNVITAVGANTFQNTVSLVFAGHENYNGSNVTYLIDAVIDLQQTLTTNNITTPVGSALVSGNLVTPGNPTDMQNLINSYSANAPLGFDPYPFQWGVPVANAVSTTPPPQVVNSIAWDYQQVMAQTFYTSPRAILMAETGWATQGTNSGYFCFNNPTNPCAPGVTNAATYLSALYAYVLDTSNAAGALVFEAYDEPAKDPGNPNDAENFYGVFDQDCNLKNNDVNLLPNSAYNTATNYGCQGFAQGALFVAVGSATGQPAFTVQISQTNPETSQGASMNVTVPTQNRTNTNIYPWPNFLVYNTANITITGSSSGTVCTLTATVSGSPPSLTFLNQPSCNGAPQYQVNCSGNNCFLPNPF